MEKNDHMMSSDSEDGDARQEADSSGSSDSEEDIYETQQNTQEMFLFLFDHWMKFSEREKFSVIHGLDASDYNQMLFHNRKFLVEFLMNLKKDRDQPHEIVKSMSNIGEKDFYIPGSEFNDQQIYDLLVQFLKIFGFGFHLNDIQVSGHMAYFFLSLDLSMKSLINPFDNPDEFLAFKVQASPPVND
jgi:hypothetical protein